MNILILQNTSPFSGLYDENHVAKIRRQANGLHIYIVDPIKDALGALLHAAHIIVASRQEYEKYIDLNKANTLRWLHVTSAGGGSSVRKRLIASLA